MIVIVVFKEFGPPTFPVAIPQPLHPEQLKLIAYLSGCVLPVFGASQVNTVEVSPLVIVKFLGGPIVLITVGVTVKEALVNIVP